MAVRASRFTTSLLHTKETDLLQQGEQNSRSNSHWITVDNVHIPQPVTVAKGMRCPSHLRLGASLLEPLEVAVRKN
jgi:hypothetical protein